MLVGEFFVLCLNAHVEIVSLFILFPHLLFDLRLYLHVQDWIIDAITDLYSGCWTVYVERLIFPVF